MNLKKSLMVCGLAIPVLIFTYVGAAHVRNGLRTNSVYPILVQQALHTKIPIDDVRTAAKVLREADGRDAASQLSEADALLRSGGDPVETKRRLAQSLSGSPASSDAWTLYSQLLLPTDPSRAAQALEEAFAISPYDYFMAPERLRLAALLWARLDKETQAQVVQAVPRLWEDPVQRQTLLVFLQDHQGTKLVERAYHADPETLRKINRWASAARRSAAH